MGIPTPSEVEEQFQNMDINCSHKLEWNVRLAQEIGLVGAAIAEVLIKFSDSWRQLSEKEKLPYIAILGKEAMDLAEEEDFVFLELESFANYMCLSLNDLTKNLQNMIDEKLIRHTKLKGVDGFAIVQGSFIDIMQSPRDDTYIHQYGYLAVSKEDLQAFE
jgi:hypothetical protein